MKYFLLFGLLILTINLFGQDTIDTAKTKGIILVAENAPEFPGGQNEMYKFLGSRIKYPKDARKNRIEGRVVISIVIERDGSIKPENIKVSQSVYPSIDNEAIRLIKLMPNWTPANHKGRNVRSTFEIGISFKLQ